MRSISTLKLEWVLETYVFQVYLENDSFDHSEGIYAFTKRDETTTKHTILYIGQTNDLAARMSNHEKMECAERRWMNRICFFKEDSQKSRDAYEKDLIQKWKPPCNELLKQ